MVAASITIDGTIFFSCLLAVLAAGIVLWLLGVAWGGIPRRGG